MALLPVCVPNEQNLDLPDQKVGTDGFDQQRVGMVFSASFSPRNIFGRIGGEQGGGRGVALAAGGANHFESGVLAFHAQVADHHVIAGRLHPGQGISGAGRCFYFKSMKLQHCLEREQNGEIVIDEKDAPLHRHLSVSKRWKLSGKSRIAPNETAARHPLI